MSVIFMARRLIETSPRAVLSDLLGLVVLCVGTVVGFTLCGLM